MTTNSPLATVEILSPNRSNRIEKIVGASIHHMAGNLSVEECGRLFMKAGNQTSANYGIGSDGRIALYVPEAYRSWCTSNEDVDQRVITIMVANNKEGDPWPISEQAYRSLIKLLVDICKRNNIESLKWEANKSYALKFQTDKQNIFVHRWFSNTECPGEYLYNKLGTIASSVNRQLSGESNDENKEDADDSDDENKDEGSNDENTNEDSQDSSNAESESTEEDKESSESYTQVTNPKPKITVTDKNVYVATVNRSTEVSDFTKFKDNDVAGLLIEAGYLFTANHTRVDTFQSPKLDAQVLAASQATLPYGFFFIARATSVDEIKEEVYQISFVIRKYPPKLGLWLMLGLHQTQATNDVLLDEYYNRLVELGLNRQLGLYVTTTQLKTITWSKHQDEWWLWIRKHYKSDASFKKAIDPSIFDVEVE